jgi:hypothetical protein
MKYIENPELLRLAQALTHEGPECSVNTRIEVYSTKAIKRDKKLFKSLENAYNDEVSHSPPLPSWLTSLDPDTNEHTMTPFGPIDKRASRRTLYLLIATLNVAFPDHEFSDVRPCQFNKEVSGASVLNALSTTLFNPQTRTGIPAPRTYSSYPPTSSDFFPSSVPTSSSPVSQYIPSPHAPPQIVSGTHPHLYRLLDDVISLADCEVFSYVPDIESDPHANDFSDDEDDIASVGDEDSSTDVDDETTFQFDDYDVDELKKPSRYGSRTGGGLSIHIPSLSTSPKQYPHIHMRRRGALLWSSHWFFLNRKERRILFISVWSRSRSQSRSWTGDTAVEEESEKDLVGERFFGWEGSAGAGARALGLSVSV